MKKTLFALIIGVVTLPAMAAQMECMVDTAAYDEWQAGFCPNFESTLDNSPNTAIWRITGTTKTISSIIWSGTTAGCASNSQYCSKDIRPYQEHVGKATILYADGTWEAVQATASFETGF
jgi:hypothetical protein